MSQPKYPLHLSFKAKEDFEDILLYTLQKWGEPQMISYRDDVLHASLRKLQSRPHIGHQRPDLSNQHRAYLAGQHVIIYRFLNNQVYVSRILHNRMDFWRQSPQD